jgi:hypothetical protein
MAFGLNDATDASALVQQPLHYLFICHYVKQQSYNRKKSVSIDVTYFAGYFVVFLMVQSVFLTLCWLVILWACLGSVILS